MADDESYFSRRPLIVPGGIAATMLVLALGPWPHGYYTLLRWVTCAVAAIFGFNGYAGRKMWALWSFGFVALLFNPIVPVYLSRETWRPIDLATAVLFAAAAFTLSPSPRRVMEGK